MIQDQSGKIYKMDHYQTRYPTNVVDIANFLVRLTGAFSLARLDSISPRRLSFMEICFYNSSYTALPCSKPIPPILHYSAPEPFTKYEICLIFARMLHLPHKHIVPESEPPAGKGACPHLQPP